MFPVACIARGAVKFGAGGPTYERTAFVDAGGDDGTAVLNNPSLPFAHLEDALEALAGAYSGSSVTIRLKSDLTEDLSYYGGYVLNGVLENGLTYVGHGGTRTVTGSHDFGYATNAANLTLDNAILTTLTRDPASAPGTAGTITFLNGGTINSVVLGGIHGRNHSQYPAGALNGTNATGASPPAQPAAASPPTPGSKGESVDANGADTSAVGEDPAGGGLNGWNVTLLGTATIPLVNVSGGLGGHGANGGNAATAVGGVGQKGGDSNALVIQDGGAGGDGGDASANGGRGGDAANGGNGGTLTRAATITITSLNFSKGLAGNIGTGGAVGSATGGAGGAGGAGALLGDPGAAGSPGEAATVPGIDGATASDGTDGTEVVL